VARLSLKDNKAYISSCVRIAKEKLAAYPSIAEASQDIESVNCYPHLAKLSPPRDTIILESVSPADIEAAKRCVIEGRFFAEHAAAGEATRLGLGTKYLLNIATDLSDERIAELISAEKGVRVTAQDVIREAGCSAKDLKKLNLGTRHMLQYSFDITKLAEEMGSDPDVVRGRQKMLIILNESTAEQIIEEFMRYRFFGFDHLGVHFLVQHSYHGISKKGTRYCYDDASPTRLHNHGQMVMQEVMDREVFRLVEGKRRYLSSAEFLSLLSGMDDKLSYNIEDLGFLLDAIDYQSLGLAQRLKKQGFRMMMEIVANNPDNPQKGGMAAYDEVLGRNVMIETFQLKGIKNKDITFLNKNFNHYMKPEEVWRRIRRQGLPMPVTFKDDHVYFQPIQGDINFLVKTAFVQRSVLKPIQSWKSPGTTPLTIKFLSQQDRQPGFSEYARRYV
jgi:hypothetical protein